MCLSQARFNKVTFRGKLSLAALSLSLAACSGTQTNGATSNASSSASGAGSVAGSSGGFGTSAGSPGTTGTTTGGTGTGSSTGNGISGTTTGFPPAVYVDGGYVSCTLASAADGGPNGDGGPAHWNCAPGTYFCDVGGNIGHCVQCLTDADCTNLNLPTFDPRRPHCDTISGVDGYQGFCQECLQNGDCSQSAAGPYCDVSPVFPPNALQPSIEDLGFEHCSHLLADCRVDGGPRCPGINQYCDPHNGQCATRTGACQMDDDCIGYLSPSNPYAPEPYCFQGTCNACAGGICPTGSCFAEGACGNGGVCDLTTDTCSCTDDAQCGGLWPFCVGLDGSRVTDAGDVLGYCGCNSTEDCGDPGLACLPGVGGLPSSCGVPCTSPEFPASCLDATATYPVCVPNTGICGPCTNDNECRNAVDTPGPRCDFEATGGGNCGCLHDGDCGAGESCQPGAYLGLCVPSVGLQPCAPGSCGAGLFCDFDAGNCISTGISTMPACITDYDCAAQGALYPTCFDGKCIQCQSNADCLNLGVAAKGQSLCCLPGVAACESLTYPSNICVDACSTDDDCKGNHFGQTCIIKDGGPTPRCGCGSDQDCAGYPNGHHCDTNPEDAFYGDCDCASDSDCAGGDACQVYSASSSFCGNGCFSLDGGACADGYFCDPNDACRPRCDDSNQCQGGDAICDTANAAGQNGEMVFDISVPGVTWCYSCLQPSDCAAGQGCDPIQGCGHCSVDANCPAGTACIDGGICQAECGTGACPAGQVCDTYGLAGNGPNLCYECVSPADCPNDEGCDSQSHRCGTCHGPSSVGSADDCPPGAICSNYWPQIGSYYAGVCLANCDLASCPATEPICAVYPGLTPDHKYCFGCLKDSDCGVNQRCNLSPGPTFTCIDKP